MRDYKGMIEKAESKIQKAEKFIAKHENDEFYATDVHFKKVEIEDLKKKIEGYKASEAKQEKKNAVIIPECLRVFEESIIKKWNEFDLSEKDKADELFKKKSYKDIEKMPEGKKMIMLHYYETKESLIKKNERGAHVLILNLISRVTKKVGEITDSMNLYVTFGSYGLPAINGTVIGTSGTAIVSSITAGGYNVQRFHVRVLVK